MKKKRIFIMSIISLILVLSIVTVFAAYTYVKKITVSNKVGVIDIDSKSYYNYAETNSLSPSDADYKRQSKLRKDTVAVLDGFILSADSTYEETDDSVFIKGKTYYIFENGVYSVADVETGEQIPGSPTYFEEIKSYKGISNIGTAYDNTLTSFEPTYSANTKIITFTLNSVSITVTTTIDADKGIITSATVAASDKNYKAVIDADGLGMVIIDADITTSSSGYTKINATEAITCSASENKINNNNIYLSQLGLEFTFTSEIAVYVRIHIQDAWKRTRVYSSTTKETYILKDQINGNSPFTVSDENWYFNKKDNCVYLKTMYVPVQNEDGTYPSQSYTFNVNEAYFYNAVSTSAYTEYIDVQVSFTVEIVQANRAKALWKIDPSTIGN